MSLYTSNSTKAEHRKSIFPFSLTCSSVFSLPLHHPYQVISTLINIYLYANKILSVR